MDRVEFAKSIVCEKKSIEEIVTESFNEIMILYNLFGDIDNIKISKFNSTNIAAFSIIFKNKKEALAMKSIVEDNLILSVYNNKYIVKCVDIDDKTIKMTISFV